MSLSLFLDTVNSIRNWLLFLSESHMAAKSNVDAAIVALQTAANETRAYLADLKQKQESNRETEKQLSRLWVNVGANLRKVKNPDASKLYSKCFAKARFWSDRTIWKDISQLDPDLSLDGLVSLIEQALSANTTQNQIADTTRPFQESIDCDCPSCKKVVRISSGNFGKLLCCPYCKLRFTVFVG